MTAFELTRLLPADHFAHALREDVRNGLTADPKWLPPKWFYDSRGSELFEEITRLPEYYPTRAERAILTARAGEIAEATRARTVVELGSGSSEKTRLILDGLHALDTLETYVPVDVSESALREAGARLAVEYPQLTVHAVVSDFTASLALPRAVRGPGWSPSSAARWATCCPPSARSSWPRCAPNSRRATPCCSAPTWSRTRPYWSPRTTTRPG